MSRQHIETIIVGAGQAGLATAYHLQQSGQDCLVLDRNEHVGDNWRQQWDSLRLFTPNRYTALPGMQIPLKKSDYAGKDDVAEFLDTYVTAFDLPIRTNTSVDRLRSEGDLFVLTVGDEELTCTNVVIATGGHGRTPNVPDVASELDPSILQLHSSAYRRPAQLQPGPVLVVGASHSGADIAFEVAPLHDTMLAGPDCGQLPIRPESALGRATFPLIVFAWRHILTRRTPMGRKVMDKVRHHGGPLIRVKRSDLAERGVERATERVVDSSDGLPVLDDGRILNVRNVVWCTGFKQIYDWIELPIFGDDGWPVEIEGSVAAAPGLYFCGLSFQHGFSSMVFAGVSRDAEVVATKIRDRSKDRGRAVHA